MSQPEKISIQHILVSFDKTPVEAKRTRDEAETLALELFDTAKASKDFTSLVREHTDDPVREEDENPGMYNLLNHDIKGENFQEYMMTLNMRAGEKEEELTKQMKAGDIDQDTLVEQMNTFVETLRLEADEAAPHLPHPRSAMVPAFGDVGFALEVGELGMAPYHDEASPFGWHIIKRIS